jgi:hypothetical protein
MSAAQFDDLDAWKTHFRAVLRQWGVDSDEPLARLIVVSAPAQLMDLVRAHPRTDFFLPDRYRPAAQAADGAGHEWLNAPPGFFLLLAARQMPRAESPQWSCGM